MSEWIETRAKHLFDPVDLRANGRALPLLAVSIHHGVVRRDAITDDEPRADDLGNYKVCEAGDIVLNRMRAFQGAIGVSPLPGLVSPDYIVLRPIADGRFLHHLFRSSWFVGQMIAKLRGIGSTDTGSVRTPRINVEDLADIRVAIPTPAVQRAIADYLDTETARIDALIAKKRHLIELLDERYHVAVEDTLWRDAPRFVRLKFICGSPSSGNRDHGSFVEAVDGVPCLRGLNVRPGLIDTDQLLYISPASHADHEASQLRTGDIVVVRSGLAGSAAMVPPELDDCNSVDLVIVRKSREVESRYVEYVINSRPVQQQVALRSAGALLKHFNAVDAAELLIPMYGESERRSLVLTLDSVRRCKDRGVSALGRQIDLLVEHRQALITAAVSGEFAVPGVAA